MKPLISCPACEEDISPDAEACPKCGHPIAGKANSIEEWQAKNRKGCLKPLLLIGASVAVLFLALMASK